MLKKKEIENRRDFLNQLKRKNWTNSGTEEIQFSSTDTNCGFTGAHIVLGIQSGIKMWLLPSHRQQKE